MIRALLLAALLAWPAACLAEEPCPSAEAAGEPDQKLDHLGAALRGGAPVDVLAIGSPGAPAPEGPPPPGSFAARFAQALRTASPRSDVRVRAIGGRGQTASEMLAPLAASLAAHPATLVLWQTGTVEAVKGLPPDEFSDALGEAAGKVAAAGADLILIDPQFSRFLRANADVEPYEAVLREAAALPSVLLFRRFDLMHAWVDDGSIDLERVAKPEREAAVQRLHRCLGEALAAYAVAAAAEPVEDKPGEDKPGEDKPGDKVGGPPASPPAR